MRILLGHSICLRRLWLPPRVRRLAFLLASIFDKFVYLCSGHFYNFGFGCFSWNDTNFRACQWRPCLRQKTQGEIFAYYAINQGGFYNANRLLRIALFDSNVLLERLEMFNGCRCL